MAEMPEMLVTKQKRKVSVASIILCIVIVAIAAGAFWFRFNFSRLEVDGDSMEHTLRDGDKLFLDRHREVKRGDIVVIDVTDYPDLFPPDSDLPAGNTFYIVKRVIALGGDSVEYHDGNVWLKKAGETEYTLLDEPYAYISHAFNRDYKTEVPEGEVFFLGDNRRVSLDSSRVGCLPVSDVVGVVAEWSMPKERTELETSLVR